MHMDVNHLPLTLFNTAFILMIIFYEVRVFTL